MERNGEVDYVQIHPGDGGCYAVIPYRIGGGMREVGLQQNGCVYTKVGSKMVYVYISVPSSSLDCCS